MSRRRELVYLAVIGLLLLWVFPTWVWWWIAAAAVVYVVGGFLIEYVGYRAVGRLVLGRRFYNPRPPRVS